MTRRQMLDQMGGANPQPSAHGGLWDMTFARFRDPPYPVLSVCFLIHILLILTLVSFVLHFFAWESSNCPAMSLSNNEPHTLVPEFPLQKRNAIYSEW